LVNGLKPTIASLPLAKPSRKTKLTTRFLGSQLRGPLRRRREQLERTLILRALTSCEWNVTAASRYLGMPLSTMKHKTQRFEIRELARRLREG
jgi:DNA-binding NtrC family response regulator